MTSCTKVMKRKCGAAALSACGLLAAGWVVLSGTGELGLSAGSVAAADCGPTPNQEEIRGLLAELMRAWVPPRATPSALPSPDSRGAKLLSRYCTQCHGLPEPKTYGVSEWPNVLDRMAVRMKTFKSRPCDLLKLTVPTTDEYAEILAYLKRHAFEPLSAGPSVRLDWKGAEGYVTYCAQCHDLPHPRQHRAVEWAPVVDRMQDYAYFIGRRTFNADEKAAIVDFLRRASGE